jgi:hypothetical protein
MNLQSRNGKGPKCVPVPLRCAARRAWKDIRIKARQSPYTSMTTDFRSCNMTWKIDLEWQGDERTHWESYVAMVVKFRRCSNKEAARSVDHYHKGKGSGHIPELLYDCSVHLPCTEVQQASLSCCWQLSFSGKKWAGVDCSAPNCSQKVFSVLLHKGASKVCGVPREARLLY